MLTPASTPDWRDGLSLRAHCTRTTTTMRATAAYFLKMRLAYRIPYHEWQEAVDRKGPAKPYIYAREDLLDAYAPGYNWKTGELTDGRRCPPWATRRYREACNVDVS